jgi:hypothetical protein
MHSQLGLMFDPSAAADRDVLNLKLSAGSAKYCALGMLC